MWASSGATSRPALAILLVLLAAISQGQQQKPTFRTEANFVRVDVYPTADGRPVQDLTAADFEVLEDGKPQKIETFEHVVVRPAGPEATRIEPNTIDESRRMAMESRGRLFVIFLDYYHVSVESSRRIRQPLIATLDRLIGDGDVFAVMTPEMAPSDITFARRTTTVEHMLSRFWYWGERNRLNSLDPIEDVYRVCYPGRGLVPPCPDDDSGVADEMILRRREMQTIQALRSLVGFLGKLRADRKAILAVTEGWLLYSSNQALARRLYCRVPGADPLRVDPGTGTLTTKPPPAFGPRNRCEADRSMLAQLDDDRNFRSLIDEANRANATFYPVDPRGLAAVDSPLVQHITGAPPREATTVTSPSGDLRMLRERLESLHEMATGTDGIAIVNNNDIKVGLERVASDFSSYYLLGYYSTGKLDGKFHSITVRVKRPGVHVRARRGYQALTQKEVNAAVMSGPAVVDPSFAAVGTALSHLASRDRDATIRFRVGFGLAGVPPGVSAARLQPNGWLALELDQDRTATRFWDTGAAVHVVVTGEDRKVAASADGQLAAGARNLLVTIQPGAMVFGGRYSVRVEAKPSGGVPLSAVFALSIPREADVTFGDPLLLRRGPFSGSGWQPAADIQFRRQERMRLEMPARADGGTLSIRVLGRNGVPVDVPVIQTESVDSGVRRIVGDVTLAPLAPADYLLELTLTRDGKQQKTFCAFRVVR